ncbi:MAG: PaaI family thioesterase [Pseudomonadota bacterium]|jgi:acyl-CoA thioesterase|uniref:Esterase n=1 Tax=Thalassovita autumnalis TaxID=2072972 RepID=A0A0P1FVT7_9RHOB|nr:MULTISPECIES: PaaI family thioesterase [Thalassovita]MEC8294204.1 PaaI family thioesterase [Pseudomonadota bacterium]CUH63881.1 Putative esterase [Thalassovita autumnalis]CUH72721.1 Putative esterase [Thalassovita autumnalis]|tara:strand:- start:505 stop:906 length:402 start_codon:yes stop_codon:yes gene_type:complete
MDILEFGRGILQKQPFSVLLGAELEKFEQGFAELHLPVRDELKQQHGFVHGGAVSYLADNALTYAGASVLGQVLTLEMKINYSRPAIGERLIARAEVESHGKRQAVCSCKVYALKDGEEKLCAIAQGTVLVTG